MHLAESYASVDSESLLVIARYHSHDVSHVALKEGVAKHFLDECSSDRCWIIDGTVHQARASVEPIIPYYGG